MEETEHLKCPCGHCGGNIAFPPHGAGLSIVCPHCGQKTTLNQPAPGTPPALLSSTAAPSRKVSPLVWVLIPLIVLTVAGVAGWKLWTKTRPPLPASGPAAPRESPDQPRQSLRPKSLEDLKPGPVTLERGQGSLLYAVGTLRNESDHQRFAVKVELDLFDATGNKVGLATDYVRLIEPRADWRFRALILDSKAAAAQLSSIQEED